MLMLISPNVEIQLGKVDFSLEKSLDVFLLQLPFKLLLKTGVYISLRYIPIIEI